MIDIQLLRKDSAAVAKGLAARGYDLNTEAFDALEARRKAVQLETEALQASRNTLSKQIGQAKVLWTLLGGEENYRHKNF